MLPVFISTTKRSWKTKTWLTFFIWLNMKVSHLFAGSWTNLAAALRRSNNNTLTISRPALGWQLRTVDASKAICKATQIHRHNCRKVFIEFYDQRQTYKILTFSRSTNNIHHYWGLLSVPVILKKGKTSYWYLVFKDVNDLNLIL